MIASTSIVITGCITVLFSFIASYYVRRNKQLAQLSSLFTVLLHSFTATLLLFHEVSLWTLSATVLLAVGLINQSRIAVFRQKPDELRSRSRRTTLVLVIMVLGLFVARHFAGSVSILELLLGLSFLGSLLLLSTYLATVRRYRSKKFDSVALTTIPTVSVCIPARNETQDLPECIESVLSSNYPKLEVLVLDDCSHDKTPEVIKEYAHRGVRFLSGQEPKDGWLAKNKAMDKLYNESTGEIVVFAGVDVRFSESSIQEMVAGLQSGSRMLSVLPRRTLSSEWLVFIQPLRYWWEIAVPRLITKRPPVLSTAWAIYRQDLKQIGGFASCKSSVQPEAHFAKRLKDAYTFVISGKRFGLFSVKSPKEQFDTAIRTRYPQLRRRPEAVAGVLLVEAVVFVTPIVGLLYGLLNDEATVVLLSAASSVLQILTNVLISRLIVVRSWLVGIVSLPFLLLEEWLVMIRSMLAYEFGSVLWKERNICLPMLKVEKSLPKLD